MSSKKQSTDRRARAEQMRKERDRAARRRRNGITIGIVVIVVVLIAVAGIGIYQATKDDAAAGATPSGATSDNGFVVDQAALTDKSAQGDPVNVVIYEDFQCPGCKAFEAATRQVVDELIKDGTIQVEYRPLDFIDQQMQGGTEYSMKAANAAICTFEEGSPKAFYEMHPLLFDNQMTEGGPGFSNQQYSDFADEVGVDGVGSCISDTPYDDFIEETTRSFFDEGYSGTPTILVEGEELKGKTVNGQAQLPTAEEFRTAVEKAAKS